ncbi:hypothetical protein Vadar_005425 [Vaccinium darrowii]|uniref:Uncharacterized protein n=1 Tax=Vaccinium darrowii TaxID=229202 RepID=A0ACB7Y694_9ERIC|nr:hypothetical protein Vadar_005425 [Vaccinium darrowii]
MEGGLPMLNYMLQHTLRSLCTSSDSSTSSKWVYAVFWRILPRNYPPPKWDYGGGALDRVKGNKRNWILVWEDGFCDFCECERAGSGNFKGRFGADVFFKMSHEVYSFGEGLVGRVAADNGHKWVFKDSPTENDPSFITTWNVSLDLIAEDLNLVINIQRKLSYLQSIPGIYALQRPYLPIQTPYTSKPNNTHLLIQPNDRSFESDVKPKYSETKRLYSEKPDESPRRKALNLGYNSPQNGWAAGTQPIWPIPPLLPSIPCTFGALLSKVPFVPPLYQQLESKSTSQNVEVDKHGGSSKTQGADIKVEGTGALKTDQEEKPNSVQPHLGVGDGVGVELEFGPLREDRVP